MPCTPYALDAGQFDLADNLPRVGASPGQSTHGAYVLESALPNRNEFYIRSGSGTILTHSWLPKYQPPQYHFYGKAKRFLAVLQGSTDGRSYDLCVADLEVRPKARCRRLAHFPWTSLSATPRVIIQTSRGTGLALVAFCSVSLATGGSNLSLTYFGLYRSDTQERFCYRIENKALSSIAGGMLDSRNVRAEAVGGKVKVEYLRPTAPPGAEWTTWEVCSLPQGGCLAITPATADYGVVSTGNVKDQEFIFGHDRRSNDCIKVQDITILDSNGSVSPHFKVVSPSRPTFDLDHDKRETRKVTIRYEPGSLEGKHEAVAKVARTPAQCAEEIKLKGEARTPRPAIGFTPGELDFGTVEVTDSETKTVRVSNTGQKVLKVGKVTGPTDPAFKILENIPAAIDPNASKWMKVRFSPSQAKPYTDFITVETDAANTPKHDIKLSGTGCRPQAAIIVPTKSTLDYKTIQRGFRAVRFITIENRGDGPLTFSARIAGADKELFGLQQKAGLQGSITQVSSIRSYTVHPKSACGRGTTGSGEVYVAVVLHAARAAGKVAAELTIEGHNAANTATRSWKIDLIAEVVQEVSLDAALVLDRSLSMKEASGSRKKIDATISAAQLFTEMSRTSGEDRLAITKYHHKAENLQPITEVTASNKRSIRDKINLSELQPDGSTCIAGGVKLALTELAKKRSTPPKVLNRVMLVLTDGKDNVAYQDPVDGVFYSVLGGPKYKLGGGIVKTSALSLPQGIAAFSVGLGTEKNMTKGELQKLASGTGQYYGTVGDMSGATYFKLEKFFTQVYMDVRKLEPLEDPVRTIQAGEEHRNNHFFVLRGDVGVIVVMFDHEGQRLPFHLLSPAGELIDVSSIPAGYQLRAGATDTSRFIELRFPENEPLRYKGRWTIVVSHPGQVCFGIPPGAAGEEAGWGFLPGNCQTWKKPVAYGYSIGVGSNFRMDPSVTPGVVQTGDPIRLSALITEAGLPVTGCSVTVDPVSPRGSSFPQIALKEAGDGMYTQSFARTAEVGSYDFTFRATGFDRDGDPVTREAVRATYVEGQTPDDPDLAAPDETGAILKEIRGYVRFGVGILVVAAILVLVVLLLE